jgi:uncharacterized protein (UPF0548 family)
VFLLAKPAPDFVRKFLLAQENQPFSYPEVGSTRDEAPLGYDVDRHCVQLGSGAETFEKARAAFQRWEMFSIPWLHLCYPTTPIRVGTAVAVLASHAGFWSLNACRIVYSIDEHGGSDRYGFAYGTLAGHSERGEERFTVLRREDGSVWYDIYAFSRPRAAARLAYPYARLLQRRFARDSMHAMTCAISR